MVATGPCHGKKATACAEDPSRPSQYKKIPEEIRIRFNLPEGACVCKSNLCRRVFGMAEEPKKPGRPSKRGREEPSTPVFSAVGVPSSATRTKPSIVVKIHAFKEARCACTPRLPARMLAPTDRAFFLPQVLGGRLPATNMR
jgi:hypothetical protein